MIWLDGEGPRKNMIEKLVTRRSGEEVCGYASFNAQKNVKIFVPYECSPNMSLAEEDFINQVDNMACSVDTSQSLSRYLCHHPMSS